MSLNIGDNFSYLGKKFLDNRQSFDTLELMNNCSDVPIGFITFCKEDNKRYEYTESGWVEYSTSISSEQAEKINAAYNHSQTQHVQPSDLEGFATEEFVTNKIAEAELGGGDVSLNGYVTDEEFQQALSIKYDNVEINDDESNDDQTAIDFYANGEVIKTIYVAKNKPTPPYISTILPENSILGLDETFNIQVDFNSTLGGRGTLKIFINDVEKKSVSINQGENIIPVEGSYFMKGNNRITIYATDRSGTMSNSLVFYVRYGSLEVTSDFDPYTAYEPGSIIRYYFTPTAVDTSLALTMYMKIDGELKEGVNCISDARGTFTFPNNLEVGAHLCEAYIQDSAGNVSNSLIFNLIILDSVSLIVASDTINPVIEEGEQLSLDYKVYMQGNTSFITKTYVNDELINTGTCGLDFAYYKTSSLTEGINVVKIEVYDITETTMDYVIWTVTVTPSTYAMLTPVKTGSMFIGSAQNMTNASENKEVWRGTDQDGAIIDGILRDFTFNSESGWIDDELLISGASSVEIPITPLANNAKYGFTLDLEFASKMIGVSDALVLKLWDDEKNCGIKITTEQVILRSAAGNQADLYFTDDEMTSVMFVIDRNECTAKIYLNGVMCSAFHLSDYSLDGISYLEDFAVNDTIKLGGSGYARVKNLRVYQVALSTDEILNNFMANETRKAEQKALVEFQKGNHLPTLTVYCDFSGLGKDDKKPCAITYVSTDEEKYGKSFTLNHKKSTVQYQGTSSMAYPIKNYRLNLADENGEKWKYDFPYGKPERRYTLKADFMSSGHWTNTGLTKWINKYLYNYDVDDEKTMNPKKWYDINHGGSLDDTRECIYGFPCRLILVNDGKTPLNEGQNEPTPGNTKDMGIFNFNHDKDATDTMGFDDDVFPNCASYEVTANSDTSAGAFMSYKPPLVPTLYGYKAGSYLIPIPLHEIAGGQVKCETDGTPNTMHVFLPGHKYHDPFNNIISLGDYTSMDLYFSIDKPAPTWLKINDMTFAVEIVPQAEAVNPSLYEYKVEDELDYIKQSFELRFPDEDDVAEGWGFLGVPGEDLTVDYQGNYKDTTVMKIREDRTYTITTSTGGDYMIGYYDDSSYIKDGTLRVASGTTTIVPETANGRNVTHITIRDWSKGDYIIVNGVKLTFGKEVADRTYAEPYKVTDPTTGLKALIDWVDGCTDEEFVRDFDQHFNRDYTLRYFLLVITLGMVDNLGKNMMLDTWDNKIFMPRFYDCDTICSYDNSGKLKFDVDIEMAQGFWNTSSSRLWTRVRDLFHDELVAKYNNMRQNGMSYETFMECFYDEQIAKIPQKYYNMDYDVKYGPFADSYIGMANGDTYEHVKRWLSQRLRFMDTLYDYAPSYNNDHLTIRANTIEPMTLIIETYTPVYQHLSWYNNQMDKKKIDGKTAVTFTGTAMTETDQEVLIYGGSNIKSIKGIQTLNPNSMLIGSATKLTELDASNCPLLYDINANKANLAPHIYLNKLNLSGCPLLGGNLIVNKSPLLREIDIRGTGITGLNLPPSIRNLETLKLPAAINELNLNDGGQLHTIEFEEGANVDKVSMSNCNALVDVTNFNLEDATNITLNNSYSTVDELYLSKAVNLSVSNMPNLERVIYTPNAEHEVFDKANVDNASNYTISSFNCPKLKEFVTTAPYRTSYNAPNSNISLNNGYFLNYHSGLYLPLTDGIYATETFIPIAPGNNTIYYSGEWKALQILLYDENKNYTEIKNVTYFNDIEKLPFDFYVSEEYKYFRFHINREGMPAPNINDFKINEVVLSEIKDYGEKKPNEVFEANVLDISSTQFKDVKLLCTTDANKLLLPRTIKNLVVDSAYDLDTYYLRDGDYDTIHTDLYDPYNTDYEGEVNLPDYILEYMKQNGEVTSNMQDNCRVDSTLTLVADDNCATTQILPMPTNKKVTIKSSGTDIRIRMGFYDVNKVMFKQTSATTITTPYEISFDDNVSYFVITYYKGVSEAANNIWLEFETTRTPNLIPSSADGSLIFSMYAPHNTTEPASGTWDMKGLDFDTFHTFGLNNDIIQAEDGSITMPNRLDGYSYAIDNLRLPNEIANYTASDANTFPTFNAEFKYSYVINNQGESYIYRILADDMDNLPTSISFNGKTSLLSVEYLNTSNVTAMSNMFRSCANLTTIDVSNWDTSNVTNMDYMFTGCANLTTIDVSNWDTGNVTNMLSIFQNCNNLTSLDTSDWDTGEVTNMASMFNNCTNLTSLDTSDWDTSKVTSMANMFRGCTNLTSLDTSNWGTSKVTGMADMFYDCKLLTTLDLSNFNTSRVTNMASMFRNCTSLQELHIEGWPLNDVTQTAVSSLPVGNDAKNILYTTVYFTVPSGWTQDNALEIIRYTASASGTKPHLGTFTAYSLGETDNGNGTYTVQIAANSLDELPDTIGMNYTYVSGLLSVDKCNCSNLLSAEKMFFNCNKLTRVNLIGLDAGTVTKMTNMFYGCSALKSLDVSNWDISKVTNMYGMFENCNNLTSLDLSNWDIGKVTNITNMFSGCSKLTSLDSMQNISVSLSLSSTMLDQTSLVDIINNLATVTTAQSLTLGGTLLAKLTEEQIAVAVNKGWTIG